MKQVFIGICLGLALFAGAFYLMVRFSQGMVNPSGTAAADGGG
jgi:hypothetical protein